MVKQRSDVARSRFYTILILPHSNRRFRKVEVSRGFAVSVLSIAFVLLMAGLAGPHLLFRLQTRDARLEHLVDENQRLRAQNSLVESKLETISDRINGFEVQADRLASALGLDELPVFQPAGGESATSLRPSARRSVFNEELGALDTRSSRLEDSYGQLQDAFGTRARLLLATPSAMPVEGWFSHGFGWRKDPFNGRRAFHRGIDIVADQGTSVVATADGRVVRVRRDAELGKTLDIDHGQGYLTRFAHLSHVGVEAGQSVVRGEAIGKVGSTGRSTGPHLHYEVFRDGRRVNPWKYLNQR